MRLGPADPAFPLPATVWPASLLEHPAGPDEPLVCTIDREMSKLEFWQAAESVAVGSAPGPGSGRAAPWRCS